MIEWSGVSEHERDALIGRLNTAREIMENGKPRYAGDPFFEDVIGVLESVLQFPADIPETEARRAVGEALFKENVEELEAESFRHAVEQAVVAFLDSTPSPYVLISSVSVKYFEDLNERELCGCRLSFYREVPQRFQQGRRAAEERASALVPGSFLYSGQYRLRYTVVTVETAGRSASEAGARALKALDVQRSLWNLALRRFAHLPAGTGPLNHVLPGPVQSLHQPDGDLLHWPLWYEPTYTGPVKLLHARKLARHWPDVQEYEGLLAEGLAHSRYRESVEGFLRDYARILDGRDPEAAFVQSWGLLERLVGLAADEHHTEVSKRAAFLVRSELRGLQHQILEMLRRYRNAGVHEGSLPDDATRHLRQLTRFIVLALQFHLDERFDFENLGEVAQFLSQPSEEEKLGNRMRTLQRDGRSDELHLAQLAAEYHGHHLEM